MAFVIGDACVACGACEAQCPVGAISMGDGKFEIDADKCISWFLRRSVPCWCYRRGLIPDSERTPGKAFQKMKCLFFFSALISLPIFSLSAISVDSFSTFVLLSSFCCFRSCPLVFFRNSSSIF